MNKIGVKHGVFAGLASIFMLTAIYFFSKSAMMSAPILWSTMLFYLFGMFKAGYEERRMIKSELVWQNLLNPIFTAFLITNIIYYAFFYMITTYFDTSLLEIQKQNVINLYEGMKGQIADFKQQQDLSTMIEDLKKNGIQTGFSDLLLRFGQGAIGGFVLSVIVAIVVKRWR